MLGGAWKDLDFVHKLHNGNLKIVLVHQGAHGFFRGWITYIAQVLGQVFSEPAYTDAAINTLRWARAPMERYPANHCALLNSVETASAKSKVVVLRGPEDQVVDWLSELRSGYKPWLKCFAVPFDTTTTPRFLPALVSTQTRSKVTAMIVEDGIVGPAFDKLTDLTAALEF